MGAFPPLAPNAAPLPASPSQGKPRPYKGGRSSRRREGSWELGGTGSAQPRSPPLPPEIMSTSLSLSACPPFPFLQGLQETDDFYQL